MKGHVRTLLTLAALAALFAAPATRGRSAPTAPDAGAGHGSGYHTAGHYRHYGYRGHYRHYGHSFHHSDNYGSSSMGTSTPAAPLADSFVRGGHRYYWHYRNGHRFYSSHPEAGDGTGPPGDVGTGLGLDLDAPLSREEQAAKVAQMKKTQQRLAAIEKRIARQRHLRRLRDQAALTTHKHP